MKKKLIATLKIVFVVFSLFAIIRGMQLVYENYELKHKLNEAKSNRDRFLDK